MGYVIYCFRRNGKGSAPQCLTGGDTEKHDEIVLAVYF